MSEDYKPLDGRTVLVTRPKAQSKGIVAELESYGAKVYAMPAIEIAPLDSYDKLDDALTHLDRYDWVVLTSVNGVKAVANRMAELRIPARKLADRRLAAIGPATAAELTRVARKPDVMPSAYVSEAIAEAIGKRNESRGPMRFLLARADIARKDLAEILKSQGAVVDEIAAYRIVRSEEVVELPNEAPDYITLTSSSAARNTLESLRENGHEDWMAKARLVCIGPVTSGTVLEMGYSVAAEAHEYDVRGLIQALIEHAIKEPIHA